MDAGGRVNPAAVFPPAIAGNTVGVPFLARR
jgi:hypothetical protein